MVKQEEIEEEGSKMYRGKKTKGKKNICIGAIKKYWKTIKLFFLFGSFLISVGEGFQVPWNIKHPWLDVQMEHYTSLVGCSNGTLNTPGWMLKWNIIHSWLDVQMEHFTPLVGCSNGTLYIPGWMLKWNIIDPWLDVQMPLF